MNSLLMRLPQRRRGVAFAAAAVCTIAQGLVLSATTFWDSFQSFGLLDLFLFLFFYLILLYAFQSQPKRMVCLVAVLSGLLALADIIGSAFNTYSSFIIFYEITSRFSLYLIRFIGAGLSLYGILINLFSYLQQAVPAKKGETPMIPATWKSVLIVFGALFLLHIPYLLAFYPGILTNDSIDQMHQAIGAYAVNNHHPAAHTVIIGLAQWIARLWGGGISGGILVYSLFQMLLQAGVFTFAIFYTVNRSASKWLFWGIVVFYAIYPIHGIFSVTMWKDVPFSCLMLLYSICILDLIQADATRGMSWKRFGCFFAISCLVTVFRNNGYHIVLLCTPVLIFVLRNQRKYLVGAFAAILLLHTLYTGPLFSALGINKSSVREALSIPLQQIARVMRNGNIRIDEPTQQILDHFFILDDPEIENETIGDHYRPTISDPVKGRFNDAYFADHQMEFVRLWLRLGRQYPVVYLESFLNGSYGYWYPGVQYWAALTDEVENDLYQIESQFPAFTKFITKAKVNNWRQIPLISLFYSIGAAFWVFAIALVVVLYKRQYRYALVFLPVFLLWLTCLASPVFAEFRYIYGLFTTLPVLICMAWQLEYKEKEVLADIQVKDSSKKNRLRLFFQGR